MNRKGSRVFVNNVGQRCVVNNIFFIRFSMGLSLFRGLNSGKSTVPMVLFPGGMEFPLFQDLGDGGLFVPESVEWNKFKILF